MTNLRPLALLLACAGLAQVAAPVLAQGLRATPQFGASRPAAPPEQRGPRPADFIVAVVNSEPITNNEVRSRLVRYEQQLTQQGASLPPRAQLTREVLERLISEKAQLQVARETGIQISEGFVDQAEQNVARQNGVDVAELRRRIAAEGIDVRQFREELRNQVTLQRLRDREVESRVRVSENDIETYLREQQAAAGALEMNLSHILVAVPEGATEAQLAQAQAKAQQLLQRARAGEDFAKLARENSDATGASLNGGLIGMRPAERYPDLFVQAASNLPAGGVSDVLRSAAGFHIIKVNEKRQGGTPAISVTQNHARHILLRPSPQLPEAAARQRLADYKRRVLAGQADFAQLARENSQDASARNGGDLGWSTPGMFVPEFEEVINSLAPGQIADPMVSRFGVHLIQLLERRQNTLSPKEQHDVARNLVREKKLDEAYVQWAQEVRGRAYVEFREPPQ